MLPFLSQLPPSGHASKTREGLICYWQQAGLCVELNAMQTSGLGSVQHLAPRLCSTHRQLPVGCRHKRHRVSKHVKAAAPGGLSYKQAGVDIDAGNELVRRIKKMNPSIGGFSGMVPFGDSFLVAGTDGVGTKLKLAFELGKHDTIGIDLVAMSVNDIITSGAKPLFFLDYFATGQLDVNVAEAVVKGIVEGCNQSDCILLGGETAEMPGFYQSGEYDVAGFAVGAVKQDRVIDGSQIQEGDVLLGMKSSGVHSNGFSLVRKVLEVAGKDLNDPAPWDSSRKLGELLLTPTVIYVRRLLKLAEAVQVKGCVHITGGGFPENLPRVMPDGLTPQIQLSSWERPELFRWLQQAGNIPDSEMYRTFNMGIGMVVVVAQDAVEAGQAADPETIVLGQVVKGKEVQLQ